jgi:para-aminobenzoate synthetase/4-amino-4-deoxychorismate lyase
MTFDPEIPYVLLDDQKTGITRFFSDPIKIIQAHHPEDLESAFESIELAQKSGHYLAGFLSYELGYLLEPSLRDLWQECEAPLLKLGVFETAPERAPGDCLYTAETPNIALTPSWSLEDYKARFRKIQDYLQAGDVYQINLTFPMTSKSDAKAHQLYAAFRRTQPGRYGGIVNLDETEIVSFSPELFFEKTDRMMRMRPMKGTRPRLADAISDQALLEQMRGEPKSQAENLMIVDLLRNDLSRLCEAGSVTVPELFALETYPTLHQMTSQVEGRLQKNENWQEIFTGLFPCGSVTGAPKIRAMEIIKDLEDRPRGAYCGSIGYIMPSGEACFNVAIRTLQKTGPDIRYDVGSGIVLDSDAEDEYRECLLKARILTAPKAGFFETFRWDIKNGHQRLAAHKARFLKAAQAFQVNIHSQDIDALLDDATFENEDIPYRVRLSYDFLSGLLLETSPLLDLALPLKIALSDYRLLSRWQTTAHKVEARNFYDGERRRLKSLLGIDEVLFLNKEDQLCEGSFTSLFIEENGKLITPPLSGILPGIFRDEMIEQGRVKVEPVTFERFRAAENVYVGNSLRGLMQAELIDHQLH